MNRKLFVLVFIIPLTIFVFSQSKAIANRNHSIQWIKKPCIKPISDYDYHTCSKMEVIIDDTRVIIPKGFVTDLASIPKVFWPVLAPQYASFVYPAILHDFLYRCPNGITRAYADGVLYSALKSEGVSYYTSMKFWLGVRFFGLAHFETQDNCKYDYNFDPLPKHDLDIGIDYE